MPRACKSILGALLLCLAASLLLSSCSSTPHPEPGAVTFLIESMPANLDPRIGTDAQSEDMDGLIFNSLVSLDAKMNIQPDLAASWDEPNPLTWVFHLRTGIHFHDGRPLTSADVKYTFDSIMGTVPSRIVGAIVTAKRGSFNMVSSIEAPDAATVIFHLREPHSSFPWKLVRPSVGIVPAGAPADFGQHPVGTGPFRFVSASEDDEVLLERNPDYFGAVPKIERLRFRVVPEAIVRALELRKGTADLELSSLSPDMMPVLARNPGIAVADRPGTHYTYIAFNFDDPAVAHREVRQALACATNRDEIVRYLLRGQARLADGPLPPENWAYTPDIARYPYDPARAEQLLDAAGYPRRAELGGMRLHLTLKTSTEESTRLLGSVLREQWKKVGVDLELRPLEFGTFYADVTRGSFELFTMRWVGANADPDFFELVFASDQMPPNGNNRGHYRNPQLDALLAQARLEQDPQRRKAIFARVQQVVAEDVPYISLWFNDNICVHRTRITNVELSPTGDFDFLTSISAN
ncbi:MAG: ABC transporter substrate-binding protein [Candidatus Acidiferrales bacterium]